MARSLLVVVFVALMAAFGPTRDATAQARDASPAPLPCSGYDQIRQELGRRYAEEPVSLGLQSNGNLLQVFASTESGTWTIISMAPSGIACVVAAGGNWENLKPETVLGSDGA